MKQIDPERFLAISEPLVEVPGNGVSALKLKGLF